MAHRNVHVFKPQQNITVYNKRPAPRPPVQQPKADKQSIWPFIVAGAAGAAGLALGIIGNLPKKTPVEITPEKPVEQPKPQEREKIEVEPLKKESPLPINTMTEVKPPKRDQFKIVETKEDYELYTIERNDTWYHIAEAKYDWKNSGVSFRDVYTALVKANYSGDDFETAMKEGIPFFPGDNIKLPKTLEINGVTISLFDNHEERGIERPEMDYAKFNFSIAKINQVNGKFYIYINGEQVPGLGPYESRAQAESAVKAQYPKATEMPSGDMPPP